MNRWKEWLKKAAYPPFWLLWPILVAAAVLLGVVFGLHWEESPLAYVTYPLSFYALVIGVLRVPEIVSIVQSTIQNLPITRAINAHPIGHRFLNDLSFQGMASIYQGLAVNLIYVVFRTVTAYLYHSIWFGAIAGYYFILSIIRLLLAHGVQKRQKYAEGSVERQQYEWKVYRLCGGLMLVLNLGMTGMAVQMVVDNQYYSYPGYVIYISALYTFYLFVTAITNLFKFRRLNSPVLSASKALAFAGAMMSVLALQTAMIARFGADQAAFRRMANSITGSIVILTGLGIALFLLLRANKHLKQLKGEAVHGTDPQQ